MCGGSARERLSCKLLILQELNPVPFCAAILNTSGWVAYSVLEGDLFIFFGGAGPPVLQTMFLSSQKSFPYRF